MFFDRFLLRLAWYFGPIWEAKVDPNRAKIASRRFLRPYFFKNADFHADLRFPMFFHQNRPQDEAKIGLRSPQDGSKTVLKSFIFDVEICLRFLSVLGPVLVALGAPLRSQVGTKIGQKSSSNCKIGLGRFLGDLGAIFGLSWAVLGRSWAVLGRSWALLGRSWPVLVALGGAVLLCGLCGR